MAKNEFTFKRGKEPRKPRPPKPEKTMTAGIKVIPTSNEYREGYDKIKWTK